MRACFTGHRPSHFSFGYDEENENCIRIKNILREQVITLIKSGVTEFFTGMAIATDSWAAEIVLSLKKEYKELKLIAVIPFENQAGRWSAEQRERYYNILAECDEVITLNTHYTKECMFERNRYLVDNSDYVLAVYDGSSNGGTFNTVNYARKKSREIIVIDPNSFKVFSNFDYEAMIQRNLIKLIKC